MTIAYFFKKQEQDQIRIKSLNKQLEFMMTLNQEVSMILFVIFYIGVSNCTSEWESDCCLMPDEQFVSYIIAKNSYTQ
jgi:hypothetical protein